jgi:hypothetical protein
MNPQAILYIIAVILLGLAAFVPAIGRASLVPLGLAFAVLAYAWPVIAHG